MDNIIDNWNENLERLEFSKNDEIKIEELELNYKEFNELIDDGFKLMYEIADTMYCYIAMLVRDGMKIQIKIDRNYSRIL